MKTQINRNNTFQIPFISMSEKGTLDQKTGMWGRIKPRPLERPAPCQKGCPAGVPIPKVLTYLQEKRFEEAIECIKIENPFPRITGRVCFHPCEENCNRKTYDQTISIRSLERFLSEHVTAKPQIFEPNGKRVAIIGSGPAGLSCSYYLVLLGYQVTLFEGEKELGGMLRFGIPKYRLPKEVLNREIEDILSLGVKAITGKNVGKDISLDEIEQNYDSIFIATGAWKSLRIDIHGDKSQNVLSALDFLKNVNQVSKLTCGKNILVIGGGNSALDTARTLLRMGAQVKVVYRRSRQEMPAFNEEIEEAEEEGIQIQYLTSPVQILTKKGKVEGLECIRNQLIQPSEAGRERAIPVPIQGSNHILKGDTILVAIGESSDLSFLPAGAKVEKGRIEIGNKMLEKIFLGGDILLQPRTVVHAIQSGKEGAINIDLYLKEGMRAKNMEWTSMSAYQKGEPEAQEFTVKFDELNMSYFSHQDRVKHEKLSPEVRKRNFKEVSHPMLEDSAMQEAQRCFQCGLCTRCENCYIFCPDFVVSIDEIVKINYEYCKGCCICVEECPRGAIVEEARI